MNIRQKFTALLLFIGVVPTLVVSVVAYISISGSLLTKTTDQLNSTAIKQEEKIGTYLQTRQEEVTKLANQYDLQIVLRQYLGAPTAINKTALTTILQNKKIEVTPIQSIVLTDLSGKVLASSTTSTQPIAKDIKVPSNSDETTVEIRNDAVDGFSKLYITTLVSINKQKTALLSVVFRTDELVAVVQDYTGLDETGETIVVAADNLSLFPLRFNTDATLQTNLSSLDLFKSGKATYKEETDYRGKQVLVVAHPIGLTDWVVATKIDKDEALASTIFLRNSIIAIVVTVFMAIILVALFLARLFTKPILRIGQVSERIGKGDFAARVAIRQRDEIGALGASVNAMGLNLGELVGNIEFQRQRLQIILDSTTETIFAIDEQANIIVVNRAVTGLLQVEPAQLVGKNMHNIFSLKHGSESFAIDYGADGVHTYPDLEYVDTKGDQRYVKLIASRVQDVSRAGKTHTIVTIHDETSSHELENMKTDFVSMAAHELRTPLTAVRGYLEMVEYKEAHKDPTDVASYIRQALKNVADLGGLINNLLDVTRIERGTLTLSMEKVDFAADVVSAVEDLRFSAEDQNVKLTFKGVSNGVNVVGDPIALREVANNLISNAIKYTRPNGKIDVTVAQKDDNCLLVVEDTGIGIPEKALTHLFTKFYRVHGGLDSGSTGTGLGLYIAKSIAERHHGTISVLSKEGVGSTFTFTLPMFSDKLLAGSQPVEGNKTTMVRRKRGWITKNITR